MQKKLKMFNLFGMNRKLKNYQMKIINRYSKPGHIADMEGFMEDQKAIAGDFSAVGFDIQKAIDKTKRDLK